MKKRIIGALAASLALMALASTAQAAITITQAPAGPGYQNLSPWNCGTPTDPHHYYLTPRYDSNGNRIGTTGLPIRLGFGWFANNNGGLKQFFQNTHGSVSITGTDTLSDSWTSANSGTPFVTTSGITWTSGEAGTGVPPGGGTVTGVATFYRGVLSIAPGTYTLSVTFAFDQAVNDGWDTYAANTSINGTCTFVVEA
jgi:hypothetical protein